MTAFRVDETSITIKKVWVSLYRAVDSQGNTLEFLLSPTRDAQAAKRFFVKTLSASHTTEPRVIGRWIKTRPIPKRSMNSKRRESLPKAVNYGRVKYLNNLIEQDHRFIKR